jgi:hypothetical protein
MKIALAILLFAASTPNTGTIFLHIFWFRAAKRRAFVTSVGDNCL